MSFWSCTSVFSGWDARRSAPSIARLWTSAATPQTDREPQVSPTAKGTCPKGWSEIGRLSAPSAGMGTSPCGASGSPTHPDCTPMQSRKKTLNTFLGQGWISPLLQKSGACTWMGCTNFSRCASPAACTPERPRCAPWRRAFGTSTPARSCAAVWSPVLPCAQWLHGTLWCRQRRQFRLR